MCVLCMEGANVVTRGDASDTGYRNTALVAGEVTHIRADSGWLSQAQPFGHAASPAASLHFRNESKRLTAKDSDGKFAVVHYAASREIGDLELLYG